MIQEFITNQMQYSEIMPYLALPRKDQGPPQNGKGSLHINEINELKQRTSFVGQVLSEPSPQPLSTNPIQP